ncbi:MAG: hypothetical protein FWG63_03885 [Defluviitaleaceae bacterium]|nr:hypothetical protein [Defluviitaleaceae bacterium]
MVQLNDTILAACTHLNNYFVQSTEKGDFSLKNGKIKLKANYPVGSWLLLSPNIGIFRIVAKSGNTYTLQRAEDITHHWAGYVYHLGLPFGFIRLCERITEWRNSEAGQPTNKTSESIANIYSWEAATADGVPFTWQDVFKKDLNTFPRQLVSGVIV